MTYSCEIGSVHIIIKYTHICYIGVENCLYFTVIVTKLQVTERMSTSALTPIRLSVESKSC